jgi:serine phosphatase RsbU (regulator of sigma subunit)
MSFGEIHLFRLFLTCKSNKLHMRFLYILLGAILSCYNVSARENYMTMTQIDSLCRESIIFADSVGNKAIKLAEQAIRLAEGSSDSCLLAEPLYSMGVALQSKARYDEAVVHYLDAFDMASSCKNYEIAIKTSNNLGILHRMTEQYDVAVSWYKKALEFARINEDIQGRIQALNNLGSLFAYQESNQKALSYFRQSLELIKKHPEENMEEASLQINIAWVLYALDRKTEALQAYDEALGALKNNPDPYVEAVCLKNMGEIFLEEEKYKEAREKLKAAEPLYEEFDNKSSKADLYYLLYQAELRRNYHKNALEYLEKYQDLQDSINTRDMHVLLADIQEKYDNERLKKEKLEQEKELERRRNLIITGGLFLSLLLIMMLFILRINHMRKRNNRILAKKNNTIQEGLHYGRYVKEKIMKHHPQGINQYIRDHFILDMPRDIVGGDFYMFRKKHGALYVLLGDATGHGIPGGFISQNCLYLFDDALQELAHPGDVIEQVIHRWDMQSEKTGDYDDGFTAGLVKIEMNGDTEIALFNQKALLIKNGKIQTMRHSRSKIKSGVYTTSLKLNRGDRLILTSDGYYDQLCKKAEKTLKFARFREILSSCSDDSGASIKQTLLDAINQHKGDQPQTDDIMVIGCFR